MNPEPQSEVRLGPTAAPGRERERERGPPARPVARPGAGRRALPAATGPAPVLAGTRVVRHTRLRGN